MSIHNKGLLVSLNIGMVPTSKKIRPASDRVETENRTAPKQASVVSRLFDKQDVKDLQSAAGAARKRFKELTLPYGRSQGLIPAAKYFDFLDEMSTLKQTFESAKEYISRNIEEVLQNAEIANGSLFDPANYPSFDELKSAMYFSIEVSPVPAANAFDELSNLTPAEIELLKQEAVITSQSKTEAAVRDLFDRLLKTLKHASDRFDDEGGGCKIFHSTVITNINKAIEAAETLNLNEDEQLIELTAAVKEIVDELSVDELRRDRNLRKEVATKAGELAARIEELF